jgi:hypothetical protein
MGRVVDKLDGLTAMELVALLAAGYSVSHEVDGFVRIFTPGMKPHQAALKWIECRGGRFVVRETTKSA